MRMETDTQAFLNEKTATTEKKKKLWKLHNTN